MRLTGQVVVEVLDGSLSSDNGLHEEAEHGEHSQTAVLDLLHLHRHSTSLHDAIWCKDSWWDMSEI